MPSHLESSPCAAVTQEGIGSAPCSQTGAGLRCASQAGRCCGIHYGNQLPSQALRCLPRLPCPLQRLPCADRLSSALGVALQSRTAALTNLILLLQSRDELSKPCPCCRGARGWLFARPKPGWCLPSQPSQSEPLLPCSWGSSAALPS